MTDMQASLPDFEDPPVVEVALSLQFDAIRSLRAPQLGLLWTEFRDRFPMVEEHPPIEPLVERFGALPRSAEAGIRFQMVKGPPTLRCWFLNQAGTELIQVQRDRFIQNWRKTTGQEAYPHYPRLRETFASGVRILAGFVEREGLGEIKPNQCEVTYVNHLVAGKGWEGFGELGNVLTVFNARYSDGFLPRPEEARLALRYVIRNGSDAPIGRLHVVVEPGYLTSGDRAIYVMRLTARGRPLGEGLEGAMAFFDIGREWVVRGFTSITTTQMHHLWRRKDGH
ncbi:MAG: TIGR04255 family protein [Planctomycetes bacterium]|nr:TIGR04255 family protein [Planctomycetota bacterium]